MVNYDAFGNGRYDLSTLMQVEPGIYLRPEAGQQYLGAIAEFHRRTGRNGSSSEGYRPLGAPGDLARGNRNTQWYWFEMYGSPRAAVPGTSNHGKAVAVDINDWTTYVSSQSELYAIFSEVMRAYGFDDDVTGEPWHWHYTGSPSSWADQSITRLEEDDMFNDGDRALAEATNKGVVDAVLRLYTIEKKLDQAMAWIGLNKWALTGNENPASGLRTMVADGFKKLGVDVDDIQEDLDGVLKRLPLPELAREVDVAAITPEERPKS